MKMHIDNKIVEIPEIIDSSFPLYLKCHVTDSKGDMIKRVHKIDFEKKVLKVWVGIEINSLAFKVIGTADIGFNGQILHFNDKNKTALILL